MGDWLDAEAHADRAYEMYERGRWAEAETELRKALALNPDQAEWHFNLGLTLEAAGRSGEALTSYERAIELMPGEAEPLLAAGIAANRLGRHEAALAWLEEAIRLEPAADGAHAHKMEALLQLGEHAEVEATYYLAQQYLEEPSPQCLAVMAESLIQQRAWGRAAWCLREALRLQPNMARARARLGAVHAAMGNRNRALQMYLRDLRDDPGNIDTLLDFGELLIELGRLPEAAEKFRRVLELEPANIDAHAHLGRVALIRSQHEQAHLEFELVLKLEPEYPQVRLNLGDALLRRGRLEDARRCLREELEIARRDDSPPLPPAALERLGRLLMDAGLDDDAVVLFELDVEVHGESPERLRALALARFRAGDRSGGAAASRRVLRLDPRCVRSMHNLALAAIEEGRLRTAAGWINRGLAIDRHEQDLRRLRSRLWFEVVRTSLLDLLVHWRRRRRERTSTVDITKWTVSEHRRR